MQEFEAYNESVRRMSRLVDDLYKENDALKEGNQFLRERCEQLEQLVKEAIPLMDKYTFPGTKDADAWTARAQALLEQETNG